MFFMFQILSGQPLDCSKISRVADAPQNTVDSSNRFVYPRVSRREVSIGGVSMYCVCIDVITRQILFIEANPSVAGCRVTPIAISHYNVLPSAVELSTELREIT